MLTYSRAFYQLKDQLQPLYEADEAAAIAHLFLEFITGLGKMDRLLQKDTEFTERQQELFDSKLKELVMGKPVQYVTSSSWFMDREFIVNENVLIPRPETEELVQWVVEETQKSKVKSQTHAVKILDIGSGSGCIGISLARLIPRAVITCVDISREALDVLKTNIEWALSAEEKSKHAKNIRMVNLDFLNETIRNQELGRYDIIVSNPPYIPGSEGKKLHPNVRYFEPAVALFVPDDDPLVFYRAIAEFGKEHLRQDGYIYCELDSAHAEECKVLFEDAGYKNVEIRKDVHGNLRMLRVKTSAP
jgi:release factor glutamine methyltransferase